MKTLAFAQGMQVLKNPAQLMKGMKLYKKNRHLRRECTCSKPWASNKGNDTPGHLAWGMQLLKTPGKSKGMTVHRTPDIYAQGFKEVKKTPVIYIVL